MPVQEMFSVVGRVFMEDTVHQLITVLLLAEDCFVRRGQVKGDAMHTGPRFSTGHHVRIASCEGSTITFWMEGGTVKKKTFVVES